MTKNTVIPIERIAEKIYLIRDEKVMLDPDLGLIREEELFFSRLVFKYV